MSEPEKPVVIVIKRITKKNAHHGGSWKIAYADFVTAMMAFFMLMWMLSMLNKYQLQGISNYFKRPMKEIFVEHTQIPKKATDSTEKSELPPTNAKPENKSGATDRKDKNAKSLQELKDKQSPPMQTKAEEKAELEKLKKTIEDSLIANPKINQYKELLNFKVTDDGLKVEINSLKNKPMFSKGKTDFEKYASQIMQWLTNELNKSQRKITIIGHTDTDVYSGSQKYSNWELSADRANATRRLLIKSGMAKKRFIRVQGAGSSVLLLKNDGRNPANRRIEIIILSNEATARLLSE
jgi:chemotaxis protein MotB